ncbi:carbon-nitrogen hydrolase family protein [Acidicapsa acidisoli]|uniref:carbon-nitrogen hydrolase family protein n=1 Tax=Acidicapsa acidisoli TaxID=1615681 RepID=UPI0021DFBEC5|nr:carbon-nitrogen hydrolase family protein [Acidicapsa acidisoli]
MKAAVVQSASIVFNTRRTLEKLADLTRDAAAQGANLVVFPEAFVGGYPKGLDFGARVGLRSDEGREDFRRYFESAIDLPGTDADRIGQAACVNGVHLVTGVIERDGGTLYCTAVHYSPEGRLLARHRKVMPTALERLVWGCGDGSTLSVTETEIGRVGSVICWENYMPLLRMAMYAQGIEIYCAPTVDDRDTWLPTMQTIAMEGRCFVLSACQYLTRGDCPTSYSAIQGDDPATVLIRGGSCVIDPLGKILVEPYFSGEAILLAELDRRVIAKGKFDLDVTGHYARPDIFKLEVNTSTRKTVLFEE